jgi:DNA-directed RNA polymerase subunit RPC12/RpoP
MVLTSLAIEFHCPHCGAQGIGAIAFKDESFLETENIDQYDYDTNPLCPRCGSKVITLDEDKKVLSS